MAKHRYIRDYSKEPYYHIGIPTLRKWQIHSGLTNFKNGKNKLIATVASQTTIQFVVYASFTVSGRCFSCWTHLPFIIFCLYVSGVS